MSQVKIGCCGFPRGMKHYFSQFKVCEVQQTFYKLPRLETALRWRREAGPDFEFTIKAWQVITHPPSSPTYRRSGLKIEPGKEGNYGFFRPSDEVMEAWRKTKETGEALGVRIIVFQCPASFRETAESVANTRVFFRAIDRSGFVLVWEPRGEWDGGRVRALCEELDLVHCVDPLKAVPLYGRLKYFRLHGGPGYRHTYTDEELERLKGMVEGETYFMFNNISMYDDALRLKRLFYGELGD